MSLFVHALASRQAAWNPTGNPEVFLREYAALSILTEVIWTFSLRWFEYRGISVQVDSLKPTVSKVWFPETRLQTWMVPCEGTFYPIEVACDMHGQTLETIWSTRRTCWSRFGIIISICFTLDFHKAIIRFSGFPLLDCWHARHLQKPRCMMQAWEKNHRASQPKSSLGAPKNGAFAALERQKCLAVSHAVPRWWSNCTCPLVNQNGVIFVGQTIYCSMPRWGKAREVVVVSLHMLCSLSWLSVLHGCK